MTGAPIMRPTTRLLVITAAIASVAGACSSGASRPEAAPTTTSTTTASTTTAPQALRVDWTGPFETVLPNGWTIRDCEGERTNVCVYDGTRFLGDIELLPGFPLSPGEAALEARAVARKWAGDMITTFRDDRRTACPGFTFEPIEVADASVGGLPGARGGFVLRNERGDVVEHVITHYAVVDGTMSIIGTDAYVPTGGCLPPSEVDPSFTPERLDDLAGVLDRIVADSPVTGVGAGGG
jgi:hypothetical protein